VSWWNDDASNTADDATRTNNHNISSISMSHHNQLLRLIARDILPVEFAQEINSLRRRMSANRRTQDQAEEENELNSKRKRTKVIVGEDNLKVKRRENSTTASKSKKKLTETKMKAQRQGDKTSSLRRTGKDDTSQTSTTAAAYTRQYQNESGVTTLFGDTIQITYKVEDASFWNNHSSTLLFNNQQHNGSSDDESQRDDNSKNDVSNSSSAPPSMTLFRHLIPLSKKIVLWCYPFDPSSLPMPPTGSMKCVDTCEEEPYADGGFPRPEMVPISSLFV